MIAAAGRIQREGEVVHLVAHQIMDLSRELTSVGEPERAFPLPHGRGDEFRHGSLSPFRAPPASCENAWFSVKKEQIEPIANIHPSCIGFNYGTCILG